MPKPKDRPGCSYAGCLTGRILADLARECMIDAGILAKAGYDPDTGEEMYQVTAHGQAVIEARMRSARHA